MKRLFLAAVSVWAALTVVNANADPNSGQARRCLVAAGEFASTTIDLITAGRHPDELAEHMRNARENRHLTRELREAQIAYIYTVASQAKRAGNTERVPAALADGVEERQPLLEEIINECVRMWTRAKSA